MSFLISASLQSIFDQLNADKVIRLLEKEFLAFELGFDIIEKKHDLGAWYTDKTDLTDYLNKAEQITGQKKLADPRQTGYLDLQMFWDTVGRPTSLMFGGGIGSTAHKPDERINISDLIKTRDFFK